MDTIDWIIASCFAGAVAGTLSIVFTCYIFGNEVWLWRFREVGLDGAPGERLIDHVGPVLEPDPPTRRKAD